MLELVESLHVFLLEKLSGLGTSADIPEDTLSMCRDALSHIAANSYDEAELLLMGQAQDRKESTNTETLLRLTAVLLQISKGFISPAREALREETKRLLATSECDCLFFSDVLLAFCRLAFIQLRFAPNFHSMANDALSKVQSIQSKSPSEEIRIAQCVAWQHYLDDRIDNALETINEAASLSSSERFPVSIRMELLVDGALMLSQLQRFEDAVILLRKASRLEIPTASNRLRFARILAARGRIDSQLGNSRQATIRLERSLKLYSESTEYHLDERLYVMWILHDSFARTGKKLELEQLRKRILQLRSLI